MLSRGAVSESTFTGNKHHESSRDLWQGGNAEVR
jgi:hypothetical protein